MLEEAAAIGISIWVACETRDGLEVSAQGLGSGFGLRGVGLRG